MRFRGFGPRLSPAHSLGTLTDRQYALSLQDPTLGRQRFFHAVAVQDRTALFGLSMQFWSWLIQQGGKPQVQVVEHDKLSSTDVVIAADPATLLAWLLYKETVTATFAKATDNATTGSDAASELRVWLSGVDNVAGLFYPRGIRFANGITCQGTTTADGGTGSGDDGASGVALIAAAAHGPASS